MTGLNLHSDALPRVDGQKEEKRMEDPRRPDIDRPIEPES